MKKLTVSYDPKNGTAFPDGAVDDAVKVMLACTEDEHGGVTAYTVSTDNVISGLRLAVAEGRVKHTDIDFVYEGKVYTLNEYASIHATWPVGMADLAMRHSAGILRCATNKIKAARAAAERVAAAEAVVIPDATVTPAGEVALTDAARGIEDTPNADSNAIDTTRVMGGES